MACSPCGKSRRDVTSEIVLSPAEAGSGYWGTPWILRLKPGATVLTAASPPVAANAAVGERLLGRIALELETSIDESLESCHGQTGAPARALPARRHRRESAQGRRDSRGPS